MSVVDTPSGLMIRDNLARVSDESLSHSLEEKSTKSEHLKLFLLVLGAINWNVQWCSFW